MPGGCCCGGGFCVGGASCGCSAGMVVAPTFIGYGYGIAPQTSFEGALKLDLMGSSNQEPSTFWQRHFEGPQTVEQLSYFDFFDRIRAALCQLGFKKIAYIKLDHDEVFNYKMHSESIDDLEEGISTALGRLSSSGKDILHSVEVIAVRRTDSLHEHLTISYSKKHDSGRAALCVYVQFAPNDVVWKKTESMADFENALDTKYTQAAKTDFLSIDGKIQNLFQISKVNQVRYLEDVEGKNIPL